MRVMQEIVISTDDRIPIRISYPSELTPDELLDLKDIIGIWLRTLERTAITQRALRPSSVPVGEQKQEEGV